MKRRIVAVWMSLIMLFGLTVIIVDDAPLVRAAIIIHVGYGPGNDTSAIGYAVNVLANPGDTVFVHSGVYYENLIINKTINLIGENMDSTTINGSDTGHVAIIKSDFVNVSGFTIRCGGMGGWPNSVSGIELNTFSNCRIFDNKILDCYIGINLNNSHGNNITANNVSNNEDGIWIRYSSNNSIIYNTFMYNDIPIDGENAGTNNIISHNEISYNAEGIWLLYTSDNIVSYNNCTNIDWFGIYVDYTDNITIINNNCSYCYSGITIWESTNITANDNILLSNQDYAIDCQNSNYIDIRDNTGESSLYGFSIYNIIGLNLTNNYVSAQWTAVDISNSYFGYIANNTITNCPEQGFNIWSSSTHNLIINNSFYNNSYAFWTDGSENNIISESTFGNNTYALVLWDSSGYDIKGNHFFDNEYGIYFWENVIGCNITGNNVSHNVHGIFLDQMDNDHNVIYENQVANNDCGINITQSNNNLIFHNNFINNTYQASDDSVNKWDNDYPQGGNYWSDYSGIDNFKGPYQNIPGADGIGDTNYTIDSDSKDNYPLMEPYTSMQFENYTLLYEGWNLVSIPLIQQDENITNVLEMIDGYYSAVKWYDASDKSDPWKNYVVGKPFGNDLTHLNETMGFWIYITPPGDTIFLYNGTEPTVNQTIQLYEGWNMVGYPSLTSHNRTVGLNNLTFGTHVDAVQWYDAADETWYDMGPDDYFVPCRGYWIHAPQDCVWEVPL